MRDVGSLRHFRFDPGSFLETLHRHGIEVGVDRQIYRAFPQFAFSGAVVRNYPDRKTLDARSPFEVFIKGRKDHLLILRVAIEFERAGPDRADRKSTRLNSSHLGISYAVFCLKKKTMKKL